MEVEKVTLSGNTRGKVIIWRHMKANIDATPSLIKCHVVFVLDFNFASPKFGKEGGPVVKRRNSVSEFAAMHSARMLLDNSEWLFHLH